LRKNKTAPDNNRDCGSACFIFNIKQNFPKKYYPIGTWKDVTPTALELAFLGFSFLLRFHAYGAILNCAIIKPIVLAVAVSLLLQLFWNRRIFAEEYYPIGT